MAVQKLSKQLQYVGVRVCVGGLQKQLLYSLVLA